MILRAVASRFMSSFLRKSRLCRRNDAHPCIVSIAPISLKPIYGTIETLGVQRIVQGITRHSKHLAALKGIVLLKIPIQNLLVRFSGRYALDWNILLEPSVRTVLLN